MSDLYDEPDEGETAEELETEDIETLRAKTRQQEEYIQKLKGEKGHEKSEFLKQQQQLQQKLAELEGRVGEQRELFNSSKNTEKDPFELTDERIEEFNNNPSKIIEFMRNYSAQREKLLVDAVTARDQYYESSIQNTRGLVESVKKEFDPERQAWRESIMELRKNEKLAGLGDDILIEIAKTTGKTPAMEYKGAAGGGVQREAAHKPIPFDPERMDCGIFLQVAQGNVEKAKRLWEIDQKKKAGK